MQRSKLVEVLARVQPALSTKDFIPVFSCFCFKDKKVYAYNDIIAIRAPIDMELEGGIRGKVLLDFMKASTSNEVELVQGNVGGVTVKAGKGSKLKLPIVDSGEFIFKFPDYTEDDLIEIELTKDVLASFRRCIVSMGYDPAHPWRLGVSVKITGTKLTMYASDNTTMARSLVAAKNNVEDEVVIVLPPRFCELLIAGANRDKAEMLYVSDSWVVATFESGAELFAKTIGAPNIDAFERQFGEVESEGAIETVDLPSNFGPTLDRALVVLATDPDKHAKLTVSDGQLGVFSHSAYGEVDDHISLPEHDDLSVMCAPELLRRGLDHVGGMSILDGQCVYFEGDMFTYLVAVVTN